MHDRAYRRLAPDPWTETLADMDGVLEELIKNLTLLPGIGRKSAARIAFFLLKIPRERVEEFAEIIVKARRYLHPCGNCANLTEADICSICSDPRRDRSLICVVEEVSDLLAIESAGGYPGTYHVLGGALSPLDGVGPEDINLAQLKKRLSQGVREIIIATNPNTEGEATAAYVIDQLKQPGLKITRIARGIPMGGFLEYSDKSTLAKAIENRTEVK